MESNKSWYNIKAKSSAKEVADVYIFDEIGLWGITAQDFVNDIKEYKNQDINLHINCIGGDVFDGMAIYNIIKKRTAKTVVYIEGIAASMGSVIALSGDEIIMSENSLLMIHNAWGGAVGEAEDVRKTADVLDKLSGEIASIYTKRTNISLNEIKDMMDEETWLNADEALELGFIDSISDAIKVAAKYDISKFKNITNKEIYNKLSVNIKNKKMTEDLKTWFNAKVDEIVAAVGGDNTNTNADEPKKEVNVFLADNEDVSAKLSELEGKSTELNGLVIDLKEEKETLTKEVARLNALISKSEAKGTEINTDGDPTVIEDKKEDGNSLFFNSIAEMIKSRVNN